MGSWLRNWVVSRVHPLCTHVSSLLGHRNLRLQRLVDKLIVFPFWREWHCVLSNRLAILSSLHVRFLFLLFRGMPCFHHLFSLLFSVFIELGAKIFNLTSLSTDHLFRLLLKFKPVLHSFFLLLLSDLFVDLFVLLQLRHLNSFFLH